MPTGVAGSPASSRGGSRRSFPSSPSSSSSYRRVGSGSSPRVNLIRLCFRCFVRLTAASIPTAKSLDQQQVNKGRFKPCPPCKTWNLPPANQPSFHQYAQRRASVSRHLSPVRNSPAGGPSLAASTEPRGRGHAASSAAAGRGQGSPTWTGSGSSERS